jgi:hypothetical protein
MRVVVEVDTDDDAPGKLPILLLPKNTDEELFMGMLIID